MRGEGGKAEPDVADGWAPEAPADHGWVGVERSRRLYR